MEDEDGSVRVSINNLLDSSLVFRCLNHTILTFGKIVKPLFPNIDENYYLDFFIDKIDFLTIDNELEKDKIKENLYRLFYGLEHVFRRDIKSAIQNFQQNVLKLSEDQILKVKQEIIQQRSNLEMQAVSWSKGGSFLKIYSHYLTSLNDENQSNYLDYQMFILEFEEVLGYQLLDSFKHVDTLLNEIHELNIETTFPRDKPFYNLDKAYYMYQAYLKNIHLHIDNIELVNSLSFELMDREIYNICHRAEVELRREIIDKDNLTHSRIEFTRKILVSLLDQRERVIKESGINHVSKTRKYYHYLRATQPLNDLYKYFRENILDSALNVPNYKNDTNSGDDRDSKIEQEITQYKAIHYALAYVLECHAQNRELPIGRKKELESIGDERIGYGKGNRFYKVFNELVQKGLNDESRLVESHLVDIAGEKWRNIVKELSTEREAIEAYLRSKQL